MPKPKSTTVNTQVVVRGAAPQTKGANSNKNKKARKQSKQKPKNGQASIEASLFFQGLTRPDLVGPIRIPRQGGANRTILGYDRTHIDIGSTTAYTLAIMRTAYTGGSINYYTAATASTAWGGLSTVTPGLQYPAYTAFNDINFIAGNIYADYIGAPLNVTGEMLIGSIPHNADPTNCTFNNLSFYPGVVRMPIKTLLNEPLTCFARKVAPEADSFHGYAEDTEQTDVPFVAFSFTASSLPITLSVTRSWEGRSAVTGYGSSYEKTSASSHIDIDIHQDVLSKISEITYPIMEALPEMFRENVMGYLGANTIPKLLTTGSSMMMHALGQRHFRNVGYIDV